MILINEMNGQTNKFCSAGLIIFELLLGFVIIFTSFLDGMVVPMWLQLMLLQM